MKEVGLVQMDKDCWPKTDWKQRAGGPGAK